ncbi:MAG: hypothetical protein US51_C0003G0019 [Microgenomates group bacterium GW2011_GWA2_37_6]|nr:MAG: hypothetical protein US51_C0003G0019 [Microgenomates group bacterium GW2011_GWA2_37_6]
MANDRTIPGTETPTAEIEASEVAHIRAFVDEISGRFIGEGPDLARPPEEDEVVTITLERRRRSEKAVQRSRLVERIMVIRSGDGSTEVDLDFKTGDQITAIIPAPEQTGQPEAGGPSIVYDTDGRFRGGFIFGREGTRALQVARKLLGSGEMDGLGMGAHSSLSEPLTPRSQLVPDEGSMS